MQCKYVLCIVCCCILLSNCVDTYTTDFRRITYLYHTRYPESTPTSAAIHICKPFRKSLEEIFFSATIATSYRILLKLHLESVSSLRVACSQNELLTRNTQSLIHNSKNLKYAQNYFDTYYCFNFFNENTKSALLFIINVKLNKNILYVIFLFKIFFAYFIFTYIF